MICKCYCIELWLMLLIFYMDLNMPVPCFPVRYISFVFFNESPSLSPSVPGNLGCFKDSGDPTPLSGGYQTSNKLTIQNCISFCRNQRYKVRIPASHRTERCITVITTPFTLIWCLNDSNLTTYMTGSLILINVLPHG